MRTVTLVALLIWSCNVSAQWTQRTNLPGPGRNHPVTFSINGTGYLTTGGSDGLPGYYDDMYKYDPVNDSWAPLGDFPGEQRSFAYGVAVGGFGYAGFGANVTSGVNYFNDWYKFDPVSETWSTLTSCPCAARTHPAMVATSDKIYVGLGGSAGGDLKDWWEYDIATDTWTQRTDFPATQRHHPYHFSIGEDVYVGMGHHQAQIYDDLYHYDVTTDSWTTMASLPAEGRVAGTQFSYNGKGYVLSGDGEDHNNLDTGEFWQYDPISDSWMALPPHPGIGRWAPGSFVIGDSLYMVAGQTEDIQPDQRDLWMFDFAAVAGNPEFSQDVSFEVYPNPANHVLHVATEATLESLEVRNLLGEVVLEVSADATTISVAELPSGVYFLTATQEGAAISRRFLKQ